jgi:RNA recognition motif-containing protein
MSSAVDNLADNLASASVQDPSSTANDTVLASAAEGRRLYIGNLAYATTEGELKEFFSASLSHLPSTAISKILSSCFVASFDWYLQLNPG